MSYYPQRIKVNSSVSRTTLIFLFTVVMTLMLNIGLDHVALGQIFPQISTTVFGNIAIAPVELDGYSLFEVAAPLNFVQDSENIVFPSILTYKVMNWFNLKFLIIFYQSYMSLS